MAITKPGAIAEAATTEVRTDVAAADSTTINDGNFPPANAVDTAGSKSVHVFCRFNGGTAPTVTIEPLIRCGNGWVKLAQTAALAEGVAATINTFGRKVFFRVHAITGAPTNLDVFCSVAEPLVYDGPKQG
ncbi:MAG: hypothetical protein HOW73_47625 [Polyangiaceae bacterium]|nr:hypothetical protein [Polyangiaceae bacterium]